MTRVIVDGLEFDWEFWGQFFDLIEKWEDDVWRLYERRMVYEKDRLDSVHFDTLPDGYFDDTDFSKFLPQIRFLGWRLKKKNIPAAKNLVTINSPEKSALIKKALQWIAKGP